MTYHQFQAIIASMDPPPQAELAITEETIGGARTPMHEDHDERYGVPSLEELGFDTDGLKAPVWIGGETEALGTREKQNLISIFNKNNFQHVSNVTWNVKLGWPALVARKCRRSHYSPVKLDYPRTYALDAFPLVFSTTS